MSLAMARDMTYQDLILASPTRTPALLKKQIRVRHAGT